MPYLYAPPAPARTPEEEAALAADAAAVPEPVIVEQGSSAPAVTGPPPPQAPAPASSGYATEPPGGNDTITGYTAPYSGGSVGQQQGYGIASPAPQAAPYVPEPAPAPAPIVASTLYGGPDPNALAISTGLTETSYPASGRPPTTSVVPSSRQAAYDAAADDWWARNAWAGARAWRESPIERRPPPPGYSPYNTGSTPGGVGNIRRPTIQETTAHRARYRLDHPAVLTRPQAPWERHPTAQPIQPGPLPEPRSAPGWADVIDAFFRQHGLWPYYRSSTQDALGVLLSGPAGSPPRQSG